MMNKDTKYKIKNRSTSMVVYNIPERNIRRSFMPGEIKEISFEELELLSYQTGGKELMQSFLQCLKPEVTSAIGLRVEPEYRYSEQDIINLMKNGSLDAFLDCLDFADIGVIDLIKHFAVTLPLNDFQKADALKKKTGFDCLQAVKLLQEEREQIAKASGKEYVEAPSAPKRRVQEVTLERGRRAEMPVIDESADVEEAPAAPEYVLPKYDVVN